MIFLQGPKYKKLLHIMKLKNMLNLKVELLAPFSLRSASVVMLRMRCLVTQHHHINDKLNKLKSKQNYSRIVCYVNLLCLKHSAVVDIWHNMLTNKGNHKTMASPFYQTLNPSYLCNTYNAI